MTNKTKYLSFQVFFAFLLSHTRQKIQRIFFMFFFTNSSLQVSRIRELGLIPCSLAERKTNPRLFQKESV